MAVTESVAQTTSQADEALLGSPIGERVARLEGAYGHLSTKADVQSVRVELEKVRTEVESVRTEIETVRTEVETVRTEVETVRTEVESLRSEMNSELGSLRAGMRANRWILGILIGVASVGVAVVNVLVTLALRT